MKQLFHAKAFTLLEVLLSIGIFSLIVAIPFTINTSIIYRIQAESAQSQIGHSFRRAQVFAQQGKNNSAWGVYVQNSSVTIFSGTSYATRDQNRDDVFTYDSSKISISVTSGSNQVVFAKTSGVPSAASTIVISSVAGSKSIAFTIDGRLTYN